MTRISYLSRLSLALLACGFIASASSANEYRAGGLKIDNPWMRATPAGAKSAGGYLSITNTGGEPDKLVGGSVEGAQKFQVHKMSMENNVMKMSEVEGGLVIKPGETVELKPGSYHIMMMGLKKPYKEGQKVKGTLTFEKAGKVDVSFDVEAIGAKSAGKQDDHMDHMNMSHDHEMSMGHDHDMGAGHDMNMGHDHKN
jgi:copper(I)-binding protein